MIRSHRALGGALAALVASAVLAACSSSQATCDCADPAITVTIPADVAPSASIQLSGPACNGVQPSQESCTNQTGGCSQYQFDATGAGTCHVVVSLAGTTFTADIDVVAATGCCTGYFASPASSATIDVPEPDGGAS